MVTRLKYISYHMFKWKFKQNFEQIWLWQLSSTPSLFSVYRFCTFSYNDIKCSRFAIVLMIITILHELDSTMQWFSIHNTFIKFRFYTWFYTLFNRMMFQLSHQLLVTISFYTLPSQFKVFNVAGTPFPWNFVQTVLQK